MSFVEARNQKRLEEIRKIRLLLTQGDMVEIHKMADVSYKAVTQTLSETHPLYSQKVIDAAWAYLEKEGRLQEQSL